MAKPSSRDVVGLVLALGLLAVSVRRVVHDSGATDLIKVLDWGGVLVFALMTLALLIQTTRRT